MDKLITFPLPFIDLVDDVLQIKNADVIEIFRAMGHSICSPAAQPRTGAFVARDVEAKVAARPGRRESAIEWREPGRRRALASSSHCAREGVERAVDGRAAVQTSTLQSGQLREIKST